MQASHPKQAQIKGTQSETSSQLKFCLEKASTGRLDNFLSLFNNTMQLK